MMRHCVRLFRCLSTLLCRFEPLPCMSSSSSMFIVLIAAACRDRSLTAMTMIYHPPHSGPPLTCEMFGQLHCHREQSDTSGRICYVVRQPGRVGTDDLNVFPVFDAVRPGDGGLAVIPGRFHLLLIQVTIWRQSLSSATKIPWIAVLSH